MAAFVKKGDLLAELAYDQDAVRTNIGVTNLAIDKENRDYASAESGYASQYAAMTAQMSAETDLTQKQIDALQLSQLTRDNQLTVSKHRAALKALNTTLSGYEAMRAPAKLLAPYDGYIDQVAAEADGQPTKAGQILVEISDTSVYQLAFSGSAKDFGYNMPVQVEINSGTKVAGAIVSDIPGADSSGNANYVVGVESKLDLPMFVSHSFPVVVQSQAVSGALTIPAAAVQTEDPDKAYVYILVNGAAVKRYVRVGAESTDTAQILDGLGTSDQVILNY